jgi:tyrosyl-tRNA synthetase
MSIPDTLIWHYFKLLTDISEEEIEETKERVYKFILNPRDVKAKLAKKIVSLYHGKAAAEEAEKEFNKVFKEKQIPSKMPVFIVPKKSYPILDFLVQLNLTPSKSEAKRLIEQGGVRIIQQTTDNRQQTTVLKDWQEKIEMRQGMIVQVGKRKFAKIIQS